MAKNLLGITYDSMFYQLLDGALKTANFKDAAAFFRDEFAEEMFPDALWKQMYPADDESNDDGIVTQFYGVNTVPVMASYTAASAEGQLIANEGFELNQSSMPTAKLAMRFNEKSFKDGEHLLNNNGIPEYLKIFNSFLKDSTDLITGIHSLRSFTGLQVESTLKFVGNETNNAGGIQGLIIDFSKNVPNIEENTQLAGNFGKGLDGYTPLGKNHDWTKDDAYPLGDLQDMAYVYENVKHQNLENAIFRMSQHDAHLLYNHPTTKTEVALKISGYAVDPDNIAKVHVSSADVNKYLTEILQIPAISVEKGYGAVQALDTTTGKMVKKTLQGFESGKVLLRPSGPCGHYSWQKPNDMFATSVNPMFITDGEKIGVQQMINTLGKEMFFNAESKGVTVPNNVDLWLYCDIATSQEEPTT